MMFYFAYAPELDLPAFARWARSQSLPWIEWDVLGPAMLRDYDLVFESFDEASRSGLPSLRRTANKRVAGALYELPDDAVVHLDAFANVRRQGDKAANGRVVRRRIQAVAVPRTDGNAMDVVTYVDRDTSGHDAPPTPEYLQSLIAFAMRLGHSHGWAMHLMTIRTTGNDLPPLYDI